MQHRMRLESHTYTNSAMVLSSSLCFGERVLRKMLSWRIHSVPAYRQKPLHVPCAASMPAEWQQSHKTTRKIYVQRRSHHAWRHNERYTDWRYIGVHPISCDTSQSTRLNCIIKFCVQYVIMKQLSWAMAIRRRTNQKTKRKISGERWLENVRPTEIRQYFETFCR